VTKKEHNSEKGSLPGSTIFCRAEIVYTSEFSRVQPCCLYSSVLSGVGSGIVSKTHSSMVVWLMVLWLSECTARLPCHCGCCVHPYTTCRVSVRVFVCGAKEEVAYYLGTLVGVLELIVMLCDRDPLQRGSLAHGFVAQ
jgi:hypothetical protein